MSRVGFVLLRHTPIIWRLFNNCVRMSLSGSRLIIMGDKSETFAAEFMGTFWLVLGAAGAPCWLPPSPMWGIGLLGVALAFGLTVLTMAYAIGHISVVT